MKNIVIFGSGGHCKVIIDIIEKSNRYNLVGIIDKYQEKGKIFFDYEIIGWDEGIEVLIKNYNIECGVIGIGDNSRRKKVVEYVYQICSNFKFETLIHPKSNIGKNVIIGDGYTDYELKKFGNANKFILFTENIFRKELKDKADFIAKNFDEVFKYLDL